MNTVYLNMKTQQGIETVDEFSREEGQNPKDFRKYVSEMVSEYHLAGMNVYKSSRPNKEWKQKTITTNK
jgi:hypothetical protein